MLEQNGAAAVVLVLPAHGEHLRHEEARADEAIEQHHDRSDEQRRECKQAENRRDEDAPDRERHSHQRHAATARLEHRRDIVQAAHREGDDEDGER